ncbi:hypothetical protein GCM10010205_79880 [Streptomyces nojiriensis]|nr:hypothetical protein GCM10010205_79880 [Streptomyces nojiriensis]
MNAVATTVLNGLPVAVTGGDETVRVWDLTTGQPIGEPFTGHIDRVNAVATTVLNGLPVAVSGGDETVRVWDLTTSLQIGLELVFPAPVQTVAYTPDGWLVAGFGREVALLADR